MTLLPCLLPAQYILLIFAARPAEAFCVWWQEVYRSGRDNEDEYCFPGYNILPVSVQARKCFRGN